MKSIAECQTRFHVVERAKKCFSCLFILLALISYHFTGCAVVRAPNGGSKDTLPPHLLGSIPKNFSRNFSGSEVVLIFDEFIKIKDQNTSVFISPEPEKPAEIKVIKKLIRIRFKTPLEKKRTYSINFGNAILDNNEGNALRNYKFAFSTGSDLDSLKITGHVSDPLDTTSKRDVYVILHPSTDDSAIYKKKPLLYTTTDKEGNFELANVAAGKYLIYALEEGNKNKRFDNKSESVAFLNNPINLKKDTSNLNLYLFKEKNDVLKVTSKKIAGGLLKVSLSGPADSANFRLVYPPSANLLTEKYARGDTSYLWLPQANLDSVKVAVSVGEKEQFTFSQNNFIKQKKPSTLVMSDNISSGLLAPGETLTLKFSEPLKQFGLDQLTLTEDSIPVRPDSISSVYGKPRSYTVYYPWLPKHTYKLVINKESITSIYGATGSKLQTSLNLGSERNYGRMNLKLIVPKRASYLVQLLDGGFKLLQTKKIENSGIINYINLAPGKYRFRVVYDKNNNNRFDTGDLALKKQPEQIINSKEVTVKANFELNPELKLPDL